MHLQPVFRDRPAYTNGVSDDLFRRGLCLPSGSVLTDDQVDAIAAAGACRPVGVTLRSAQPSLEAHAARRLAGNDASSSATVSGVAPEAVEVGRAGDVGAVAGERGRGEPPAHDDLGGGRRRDGLRVGEVAARVAPGAPRSSRPSGRSRRRPRPPTRRRAPDGCGCASRSWPARSPPSRQAGPADRPAASGNGAPRSTKSVDDVERRRQVPLDERGQHDSGQSAVPSSNVSTTFGAAGDAVGG